MNLQPWSEALACLTVAESVWNVPVLPGQRGIPAVKLPVALLLENIKASDLTVHNRLS